MLTTPRLMQRHEQHYSAIRTDVAMKDIPEIVPPLLPVVQAWLKEKGIAPDGPPFFRYLSMKGSLITMEAGVPVKMPPGMEGRIIAGSFPAGRYVTVLHTGPYSGLRAAHMALESWSENNELCLHQCTSKEQTSWGCRTETYLTDPNVETDPASWQTEIAFLLEA